MSGAFGTNGTNGSGGDGGDGGDAGTPGDGGAGVELCVVAAVGGSGTGNMQYGVDPPFTGGRWGSFHCLPFRPGGRERLLEPGERTFAAEVEADLKLLAPVTRAVRTYAALEGAYDVPALAAGRRLIGSPSAVSAS